MRLGNLVLGAEAGCRQQRPHGAAVAAGPVHADEGVLEHGEVAEERVRLQRADEAAPDALGRRCRGDVAGVEQHVAAVGRQRAGEEPQDRRLPGAVRPDERGDRARGELQ